MIGLGGVAGGSNISRIWDLTYDGAVMVGTGFDQTGYTAAIWDEANGMRSIRNYLEDEVGVDLAGWRLVEAFGISDDGTRIAGTGFNPEGNVEAWLAVISDTGACCLCGDQCEFLTETGCIVQGGVYQGDGTECPPPGCTRYRLHNHPDGDAAPPFYGLRLDGLLTGDDDDVFTFDFDDPQSAMVLDVCEDGTIHIFGQAVLNQPPNGVWQVDFADTNVTPVGGDGGFPDLYDQTCPTGGSGTITSPGDQVFNLEGYCGSFGFNFRFGDEDGEGHRGFDGLSGWGWLNHNDLPHMVASDWLFTADLFCPSFPCPSGACCFAADNGLHTPLGIAVDAAGNAYVTGGFSDNAFKITPAGVIIEIIDCTGDGTGNCSNHTGHDLSYAVGIAVDAAGNVYVAGELSDNAFKITPAGVITEIIDAAGDGAGNNLNGPVGIAVDVGGDVYVAGLASNNAFKITPAGVITEIIDLLGDRRGNFLFTPFGIAVDSTGNAYVTGAESHNAFKITPAGVITEIINSTGDGEGNILNCPEGIAVDSAGNAYVASFTSSNAFQITPSGVITEIINIGDGLAGPERQSIAEDGAHNTYVTGLLSNNAFKITPGGVITEIIDATGDGAGNSLNGPVGIAVDAAGNAYVTGQISDNAFKITPGGVITEIIDASGDGACLELTEDDCAAQGGDYQGDNTPCDPDPCPQPASGDMNQDGVVDGLDIRGFTDICVDPANAGLLERVLADLNGDGQVDTADLDEFVQMLLGVE